MRASSGPRARRRGAGPLLALVLLALAPAAGGQAAGAPGTGTPGGGAAAGPRALEPAFRLAAGGRALAGPLVESSAPATAWMLSEDGSLYALTEAGSLVARIPVPGEAAPFLALDPFARALCLAGAELRVLTRSGTLAYAAAFPTAPAYPPAFGSDGRAFVAAGRELYCLNPAGRRLWSYALPAAPSCPPAVDASGRPALGLADGSILILTPYGELAASHAAASPAARLAPMAEAGSELPVLAAALADGSLLLLGDDGAPLQRLGGRGSALLDLAWDGALLYTLDAAGRLEARSASGAPVWAAETGCSRGRIALFKERIVVEGRGRAVSLSLEGQLFREISISHAAGPSAAAPSGLLFAPGEDWVLAAYRFEAPLGPRRRSEGAPYPDIEEAARKLAAEARLYDPFARDADRQNARLDDIEKKLRSGSIGVDEPEAAAYCAALAARYFDAELAEAERRSRDNPLPRARACAILGALGSPGYRGALAAVLSGDPDPAVRDAACDALADIGVDPGGLSGAAFLKAARAPAWERTALSLIAAIERMALRSGSAPGRDAVGTLLALASKPYGPAVRSRASVALGRIAGAIAE
ncbi:MAG TPA: HEAT repeat domain-containing protein [Spirochaetia bacterium]|nr:HEAT repeat domain-containing protein [Spirochaetia bacterium]